LLILALGRTQLLKLFLNKMDGNENVTAYNISENTKLQFSNLYWSHWNAKDPSMRNFFVDPDTLEVRSQYWEHMTIIPILATIMLAATVFLLVLFRQSPTMVAATVAACLIFIGIYLILNTLNENRLKYE